MLVLLLLLLPAARALTVAGSLHCGALCAAPAAFHGARVVLDDGRWAAAVRRDGRFALPHVPPGTFLLSVLAHDVQFDQLRIDVTDAGATVRPYTPGTPLSPPAPATLPYPITLAARSTNTYFVAREAFNLVGMFQSPMMLVMVFTGAMLFAMPYLMASLDPETRNDVRDRQQKMLSAQTSLQNMDMGGLRTLLAAERDDVPKPAPPAAAAKGRGKGRKR